MKPSAILTSALATLAIASPAITKREASPQSPSLVDMMFNTLEIPTIPIERLGDLFTCMRTHKTFHTDFSKADDGTFSITNVDHTCCEQAKEMWEEVPNGQYGKAVFTEPCDGATVTGLSKQHMGIVRDIFDSI